MNSRQEGVDGEAVTLPMRMSGTQFALRLRRFVPTPSSLAMQANPMDCPRK